MIKRIKKWWKKNKEMERKMREHDLYGPKKPNIKIIYTPKPKYYKKYPLSDGKWVWDESWSNSFCVRISSWSSWTPWEEIDEREYDKLTADLQT